MSRHWQSPAIFYLLFLQTMILSLLIRADLIILIWYTVMLSGYSGGPKWSWVLSRSNNLWPMLILHALLVLVLFSLNGLDEMEAINIQFSHHEWKYVQPDKAKSTTEQDTTTFYFHLDLLGLICIATDTTGYYHDYCFVLLVTLNGTGMTHEEMRVKKSRMKVSLKEAKSIFPFFPPTPCLPTLGLGEVMRALAL